MRLFDSRLMKLLTFLTRRQAWLAPNEVSGDFRPDGGQITPRTIHRWFHVLREKGSFIYYPYPKANVLGLQDVLVRIRGLRNPDILGILPFAASFNVEVGLGDGQPFVSQGYWVPASAMEAFKDFWRVTRDLGFASEVGIFPDRNTHFIFSPFDKLITEDGAAALAEPVDNSYFEPLLRRHIKGKFEVRVSDRVAEAPLTIPLVIEHIWVHYSSRHVWQAIREKGEEAIRHYAKGPFARIFERPGAALRLLQQQWSGLLDNFEEVFLQPRVLFLWTAVRNAMWVSAMFRPKSIDTMVEAATRLSQRSILVQLRPGVEFDERCHVLCWAPNDQLPSILHTVRQYHEGHDPPFFAVMDQQATIDLFQPSFCKLDWRLFDPNTLSWQFDESRYIERLKGLPA
jgi:hypothetical protein